MIALCEQTWLVLQTHRVKSLLAIFSIAWGITSVVVLVALGEGFYRYQIQRLSFMVNNVQIALPSSTSESWKGLPSRRKIEFSSNTVDLIKQTGAVEVISSVYAQWDTKVTNDKGLALTNNVSGIDTFYFSLVERHLEPGSRPFSMRDLAGHRRVAIIGNQVAKMSSIKIGQTVKVKGVPLLVIGILTDEDTGLSFGDNRKVFIPQTTYLDLWNETPWMLLLKPAEGIDGTTLRRAVVSLLSEKLFFDPNDNLTVNLPDFSERNTTFSEIFRAIQMFLGASGTMTMAVGTLGVTNIMFLSVAERTREIGVRLAIGATQSSILIKFIFEGLALVTIGAVLGLMIAIMLVALLRSVLLPEWLGIPIITPVSIVSSLITMFVFALLASYFPARRASLLTPVVALGSRG